MDLQDVLIDDLVLDPNLNLRDRLDEFTVERYAEAWDRMPPVTVFEVDGQWLLADGLHRHAAAVMVGRKSIPAEIRIGTYNDALDFVAGVNLFHGLPLTRAERRRAVEIKLRLHHEFSDRRLAEELGVGRELVAKIRKSLVEGGQVPMSATRVGADGKTYPSQGLPKDPNERLPRDKQSYQDDPRDRGKSESDGWDDTVDPMPAVKDSAPRFAAESMAPPWEGGDAKAVALAPPVESAAPTIDEMLSIMAKQVMEVVSWTQAEGFTEAYATASANSRGLFQSSVIKLAARADQLRKL